MPNAELAYRVLDEINAHREHFAMYAWAARGRWQSATPVGLADLTAPEASCGTTACFAGWAIALSGLQLDGSGRVFDGDVFVGFAESYAADLLGIKTGERDDLFFVPDAEIEDVVEDIFGPRPGAAS